MPNTPKLTPEKRAEFLTLLAGGATVTKAARAIGVARRSVYTVREKDTDFAAAWSSAEEEGTDWLEEEAMRRGRDGTEKPVFQGGVQVGMVREYSDTLLIFMLKGRRPEKFKDRVAAEHSGPGGNPIEIAQQQYLNVSDENLKQIERLMKGITDER